MPYAMVIRHIKLLFTYSPLLMISLSTSLFADTALLASKRLSVNAAETMVDRCIEKQVREKSSALAIAVFDAGGSLLAYRRMEGVAPGIASLAMQKGKSAAAFGHSTQDMGAWIKADTAVLSVEGLVGSAGGVPIFSKRYGLLGGVGVSGGSSEVDLACARHALQALAAELD